MQQQLIFKSQDEQSIVSFSNFKFSHEKEMTFIDCQIDINFSIFIARDYFEFEPKDILRDLVLIGL